jgi:hypothetical protein
MRQGFLTPGGPSDLPTIFRIQKSSHSPTSPRSESIPRLIAKVG